MRVLLAILVGLLQVAGPWLCCCGSARAATPAAVSKPVETCPHCRCQSEPPAEPPALPDPCPCGGTTVEPAPPAKPEPVVAVLPDAPAVVPAAAGPTAVLPPPAGVSDLPFLPPGTRLFVHHVLRC